MKVAESKELSALQSLAIEVVRYYARDVQTVRDYARRRKLKKHERKRLERIHNAGGVDEDWLYTADARLWLTLCEVQNIDALHNAIHGGQDVVTRRTA